MAVAYRPLGVILAVVALGPALAGCAPQQGDSGATASPDAHACVRDKLKTLKPGTLTIGTDDPVYPPWFVDNKPDNGKGFESAVAYAVADELGYTAEHVAWTR